MDKSFVDFKHKPKEKRKKDLLEDSSDYDDDEIKDMIISKEGVEVEYNENFNKNYQKKQMTSRSEGNRFVKNKML